MATDKEKLAKITTGDLVTFLENGQEVSGPVIGFRLHTHRDKPACHSVIVRRNDQEQIVPLRAVVARQRSTGTGCGTVSWR